MKIIDLSKYNTVTDWSKVANAVDGVIIRCGYRGYGSGKIVEDIKLDLFASNCKKYKIPFGLYFMSQAITLEEGVEEAEFSVKKALAYGATLGIFIDSEDGDGTAKVVRADGLSMAARTSIAVMFCNSVKAAGFIPGVYASTSWFHSRLNVNKLLDYKLWVAQYNSKCTANFRVDMWQYTDKGSIDGIAGSVDVSEAYNIVNSKTVKANPYPAPTRILKLSTPYMKGDDVKWLQFELGFDEKDIDGIFGPGTSKKYKTYLGY